MQLKKRHRNNQKMDTVSRHLCPFDVSLGLVRTFQAVNFPLSCSFSDDFQNNRNGGALLLRDYVNITWPRNPSPKTLHCDNVFLREYKFSNQTSVLDFNTKERKVSMFSEMKKMRKRLKEVIGHSLIDSCFKEEIRLPGSQLFSVNKPTMRVILYLEVCFCDAIFFKQ